MRGKIIATVAILALSASGLASASIIYDVGFSFTGVGETVTGSITTNGTVGQLSPGDITAWDLNAAGLVNFHITSVDFGGQIQCDGLAGCSLYGSAIGLVLGAGETDIFDQVGQDLSEILLHIPGASPTDGAGLQVYLSVAGVITQAASFVDAGFVVGSVAAPVAVTEPSTLAVLGIGLAGLGVARKRTGGRQATAV